MDVSVDIDELEGLGRDLRRVKHELDDLVGMVDDYLPAVPPHLAEKLGGVAAHWARERRLVGEAIEAVAHQVDKAASRYREAEAAASIEFTGSA